MSVLPPTQYRTTNPFDAPQVPSRKGVSWVIVVLLVAMVGALGFFSWYMWDQNQKLEAHVTAEMEKAQTVIDELQVENKKLNELLGARELYGIAWNDFNGALSEADAYFNTDSWIAQANASFEVVMNEREDVAVIQTELAGLKALTEKIVTDVDAYEVRLTREEKERKSGLGTNARAAMDAIDPTITLTVVEKACEQEEVLACVTSLNPRNVQVTAEYVNYDYDLWFSVMMHEYAHVYQFTNYIDFTGSETVKTLFNGDAEFHADCMAEARVGEGYVSTYDNVCTPEQVTVAGDAWNGNW